ncbi:organic solute transporter Ostalpha-domain-containing protein [Xylariaceae sp. FL0016]|nr:organic solute transporter Ostalpha-domain-containing protein [Xylariaceae sp. FL0016]
MPEDEPVCTLPRTLGQDDTLPLVNGLNFNDINVIVSTSCCTFALILVVLLMGMHAGQMTKPRQQLNILKICVVIPSFCIGTVVEVNDPNTFVYIDPWLKAIEAYAIGYFFLLMMAYLVPEDAPRRDLYLSLLVVEAKHQHRPSVTQKLRRYRLRWLLVFQSSVVLTLAAIAANVTEALDVYCLGSIRRDYAYIYLKAVEMVSIITSVVTVMRTYAGLRIELKQHRSLSKLFAFKALIGLQVLQSLVFVILQSLNPSPLDPSAYLSDLDIEVGIPLLIVAIELVFFSIFFHYAYSVTPYQMPPRHPASWQGKPLTRWRLLYKSLDPSALLGAMLFTFKIGREARLEESKSGGLLLSNREMVMTPSPLSDAILDRQRY